MKWTYCYYRYLVCLADQCSHNLQPCASPKSLEMILQRVIVATLEGDLKAKVYLLVISYECTMK